MYEFEEDIYIYAYFCTAQASRSQQKCVQLFATSISEFKIQKEFYGIFFQAIQEFQASFSRSFFGLNFKPKKELFSCARLQVARARAGRTSTLPMYCIR